MKQKIILLIKKVFKELAKQNISEFSEELAGCFVANGVIIPPCRVGDTVYEIYDNDDNNTYEICEGKVEDVGSVYILLNINQLHYYRITELGKSLFLTKEEAESKCRILQAARERERKNEY